MNLSVASTVGAFCSLVLLCQFIAPSVSTQSSDDFPTIIHVDRKSGTLTFQIDSQSETASLDYLIVRAKKRGKSHPVVFIVNSKLPLETIWNLGNLAGKAQLDNVRYFVHFSEFGNMTEIKKMPILPFSTDPEHLKQ